MRTFLCGLLPLALATSAQADPFCDALLSYVHDAPNNAIVTIVMPDKAGPQTVARTPLPGARCLVSPYNPTDIAGRPREQSVYCFWSATEEEYPNTFSDLNGRVAACMGQEPQSSAFATRLEYNSNYGTVRVAVDQMTNDWAISVTVMPLN
jgi:hypothetical protein